MKKGLILGIALCAAVCLTGCHDDDICRRLSDMAEREYRTVTLNASCTLGGMTLTGVFNSVSDGERTTVRYRYEQEELILPDGEGGYLMPEDEKTVKEGETVFEESNALRGLSALNGAEGNAFVFEPAYFEESLEEDGRFSASVADPSAFLGRELSCTEMRLSVVYSSDAFEALSLSYLTETGVRVTLTYGFTL